MWTKNVEVQNDRRGIPYMHIPSFYMLVYIYICMYLVYTHTPICQMSQWVKFENVICCPLYGKRKTLNKECRVCGVLQTNTMTYAAKRYKLYTARTAWKAQDKIYVCRRVEWTGTEWRIFHIHPPAYSRRRRRRRTPPQI